MNPYDTTLPPACADDFALEALVAGTLAPDRERALEAHLGGCAACRGRLDAIAASPESWSTVREQLSAGAEAEGEDAAPPIPALASLIQKILAPSDDERMLGRLGPYEITGIIGSGGMGIVLKGHDRALDRFVAIKLLSPHLASSGAARQRFLREAKAAAAVVHDNVIAIHGVDEFAGLPYLVMPYCRGTTLEKRIRDTGPMNLREILRVGLQTARGLAAAHAQGLVHRDVKPANILLEDGVERVRITDFGLARAADDASLTVTGLLAGTPHYMSPEQALGKPLDARSDLFALGAVLFTLATGKPPFRAESSHAVLRMVTDVEPADVRLANPDMPAWLAGIVGRLLAKEPAARYPSANEVAGMLEACLAHVNDPLAIPLPPDVVRAAAAKPSPAAPAHDHPATPRTFLDSLRRIMSDQRLLSIAALVIFLMALLLPWPILALGRAEPAITYAVIATLTSLLFAWLGRSDSLGRLVLTLAGTAAILGGAVVAFPAAVYVLSEARPNAERVAALRAENLAKQAQMEAIGRTQAIPIPMVPMSIPVPTAPRVASGPDPMPVVGWPGHNAPAELPVLTATVPANALPTVDPLATSPVLPPAAGSIAPIVPVEPQRVDLPVPGNPELLPPLPTLPPSSDLPAANAPRALVLPPEGDLPPPVDGKILPADDWDIIRQQWESNLEMTDEWLADARTVARGRMTVRERVIDEPSALEVWRDSFEKIEFGPDASPAAEQLLSIDSPTNWQNELTTAFRGRSVMSIIKESGVRQVVEAGNTITVTTDPEPGDGYEQRFRFMFDRETGAIQAKSHEVRFRRAGPFQRMNLTRAGDFRLVASGVPLPHRITVEHSDLTPDFPADEIAPLARSITIDIAEWKPSPEGTEEDDDSQDPAEEWGDDESPEDADKPKSETEESESIDEEQEAPEANQVGVDQADVTDDRIP